MRVGRGKGYNRVRDANVMRGARFWLVIVIVGLRVCCKLSLLKLGYILLYTTDIRPTVSRWMIAAALVVNQTD